MFKIVRFVNNFGHECTVKRCINGMVKIVRFVNFFFFFFKRGWTGDWAQMQASYNAKCFWDDFIFNLELMSWLDLNDFVSVTFTFLHIGLSLSYNVLQWRFTMRLSECFDDVRNCCAKMRVILKLVLRRLDFVEVCWWLEISLCAWFWRTSWLCTVCNLYTCTVSSVFSLVFRSFIYIILITWWFWFYINAVMFDTHACWFFIICNKHMWKISWVLFGIFVSFCVSHDSGPAITAHGSFDLKQDIEIQIVFHMRAFEQCRYWACWIEHVCFRCWKR
jgi:hypothetical protein